MKRLLILFIVVLIGLLFIPGNAEQRLGIEAIEGPKLTMNPDFGKLPLYFIPNKGQVNERAKFYAKMSRYTLWMTKQGLVFDSVKKVEVKAEVEEGATHPTPAGHPRRGPYKASQEGDTPRPLRVHPSQEGIIERDVSRLVFMNANKNVGIVPLEITGHKVNYFIGNDSAKWQKGISTSTAVLYKDIYKNIDLKIYGNENQIEYDWIVKPGGNPADILFEYKDVKDTGIDNEGNLVIKTGYGNLIHKKPVSYQLIDEEEIKIKSQFKKIKDNCYGFYIGEYKSKFTLSIDPVVLIYSTYLGGNRLDTANAIAVDSEGNSYVVGVTNSLNFPSTNDAYGINLNGEEADVFVTKLNSSGSNLLYSTFLGGTLRDNGNGIAVDNSGCVYITGRTFSADFPTTDGAYERNFKGEACVFVTKLNETGSDLLYSTFLGGNSYDFGFGIALDINNNAYVTGNTISEDFPTTYGAYNMTHNGGEDCFVVKLNISGSALLYSTFLGGSDHDWEPTITVDYSGNAYVSGFTASKDFPTSSDAYDKKFNGGAYDVFVCKLNTSGSVLLFSTFIGGTGTEWTYGNALAVDINENVYVSGRTDSKNYPTTEGAYDRDYKGNCDAFITKLNSSGSDLLYSTYLGGSNTDNPYGITVDNFGHAYVGGITNSSDFPVTSSAYDNTFNGGFDAFLTMLSQDGSTLLYSTFMGGRYSDIVYGIALGSNRNIYLCGQALGDLPTTIGAYDRFYNGSIDGFVSSFSFSDFEVFLTVKSSPDSGVYIIVSPEDNIGNSDGETAFTRAYIPGTIVTLTAPETFNNMVFYKWTIDYIDNFNRTIQAAIDDNHTVTAVYHTPGELSLSRSQLYFGANTSGAATGKQTFFISKSGESTLNWTVSDNVSWLTCSPTSGTNSGEVIVSVDAFSLAPGTYYGTITVSAPHASNSPQHVNVTLFVYQANTTGVPFGFFETPRDGAYVYSSIPVTGWTLDDIGVEHVKIYRQEGKNLVYIGTAVFVEGARPDVELAYPHYPNCYRAGWGYMMLTNFLPNGGNGTFTLYAIATDKEGNHVTLGTKTIECDNANAVRPFGAIDTPSQGGTAIGTNYRNQGWVLTPLPNKIPEDGHTIIVWIDGVNVGNTIYNIYRKDIAALFPGYANSNGAMAYFDFDTTGYENGVHTIQWTAVDNAGNVDGIGSRYFTIQNTGESAGRTAQSAERTAAEFNNQPSMLRVNPSQVPPDYSSPIRVKKGYNQNIKPHNRFPDEKGNITIQIKELERIEIHFPGPPTNNRMGFLVVGDQLRTLPIGSTFKPQKGIFYWMPGPGFIGTYRFIFLEEKQNRELSKTFITVNILPKFTGKAD